MKQRTAVHKLAPPAANLELTNLDKVFFPEDGYTKGDLLDYYRDVAPVLLPYLKDRPMNLNRHPNGIHGKNFYQKDVSRQSLPAFVQTTRIVAESDGDTVEYIVCQNLDTLLFVVNLGCIEINPWNARVESLDYPDYLIFDLDPVETPFTAVVQVALAFRKVLESVGIEGYCKTSGKRGLHIYLPLGGNKVPHDQGRVFAGSIARKVHERLPELTSFERSPDKRHHQVYLDILQNRHGQSLVVPYSVRPRPHATVSTPLRWSEVTARLDPTRFTIKSLRRRLDRMGDLWKPVLGQAVNLLNAQKKLEVV